MPLLWEHYASLFLGGYHTGNATGYMMPALKNPLFIVGIYAYGKVDLLGASLIPE